MIVGRFAPSPSGRMHLGNIFTALIAWLSVRSQNGKMLLRIEDLDPDRSKQVFIDALYHDLQWLGLDWDEEMPLQSTRSAVYEEYFSYLPTYPCFCTRNELHSANAPHASDGRTIYAGTCRNLAPSDYKERKPSWRVKVDDGLIAFEDGICGRVEQDLSRDWGDFIVRRSDGVYAYQLAVVCDDALGGVTEVVRGNDLLSSTPAQLWLYDQLGFSAPKFYHVPLLVAPDGRRLSKRERDLDISELKKRMSAEEIIGRLAHYANLRAEDTPITAKDLCSSFSWEKLSNSAIVIDDKFYINRG